MTITPKGRLLQPLSWKETNLSQSMIYICTELLYPGYEPGVIREIRLPPFLSPKSYRPMASMEAFRYGHRKGVSKKDKQSYRVSCQWGPDRLYHTVPLSEWEDNAKRTVESFRRCGVAFQNPLTQERIVHESVEDFFQVIGFDRYRRCYVDKDGKPIKYTTA